MKHVTRFCATRVAIALTLSATSVCAAQLRIATFNITNYESGRESDFKTAIYGVFQGRSFAPDLILAQELLSQKGVDNFVKTLNGAEGSPGDWAAAKFTDGNDTDSALFYRKKKVSVLQVVVVSKGGNAPKQPRDIIRYDIRPVGYSAESTTVACYSSHMKSGSTDEDYDRRVLEARTIRDNAAALDPRWQFILGGDFNIPNASEDSYQILVSSNDEKVEDGRFFDPIATPAKWNNNEAYRFVHTQDPAGAGGMDDRFDQLLLSAGLVDGDGFDYIGNPSVAYSDQTWDDSNHSYRAWGNDGTSYNKKLTTVGNTMVGETIAKALVAAASGQGHIPVFLDMRVPAEIDSSPLDTLDFGRVAVGSTATATLNVWNAGNIDLWTTSGIATLRYSFSIPTDFGGPSGDLLDDADDVRRAHTLTMDTSSAGVKSGVLTIHSNAPDEPEREILLIGEVFNPVGDANCDGAVDFNDIDAFIAALIDQAGYESEYPDCDFANADCNQDGRVDFNDIDAFIALLTK